jgi:hypothetical protein
VHKKAGSEAGDEHRNSYSPLRLGQPGPDSIDGPFGLWSTLPPCCRSEQTSATQGSAEVSLFPCGDCVGNR